MLGDQKWVHSLHVLLELLHVPLELRPPVLEPRDHLGIAQTELSGDLVPVGWAQVLLIEESFLQLEDLLIRERGPTLALLLRLLAVVEQVQVIGLLCNTRRRDTVDHAFEFKERNVFNPLYPELINQQIFNCIFASLDKFCPMMQNMCDMKGKESSNQTHFYLHYSR